MARPIPWTNTARALTAALLVVALSFIVATLYSQHRESRISTIALDIARNAAPSVRELAAARTDLAQLRMVISQEIDDLKHGRTPEHDLLTQLQGRFDEHLRHYFELPHRPAERLLRMELNQRVTRLNRDFATLSDQLTAHQEGAAEQTLHSTFEPLMRETARDLLSLIELNAGFIRDDALVIMSMRHRPLRVSLLLNLLSLGSAVTAALLLTRALRRFAAIDADNERLRALHSDELERVAQRMAHDIRNPLAAIALAFDAAQRSKSYEKARMACERGARSLARANQIVSDLLTFARAGAVMGRPIGSRPGHPARSVAREHASSAGMLGGVKGWLRQKAFGFQALDAPCACRR